MTKHNTSDYTKSYTLGYEVYDVSPLSHYFEEIYGHIKGIESIGPRGDQNYFWYSKNNNGSAYYEINEQKLSAQSTYDVLKEVANKKKYYRGINEVLGRVQEWADKFNQIDLEDLSTEQAFQYSVNLWQLDADVFSYYLVGQPYRLKLFEDEVRWELQKRVAKVRIDDYLARLVASPEMTENAREELEWSKLLVKAQESHGSQFDEQVLREDTDLLNSIKKHFDEFKLLNLGDGKWDVDPEAEITRFLSDYKISSARLVARINDITNYPIRTAKEQSDLIESLDLPESAIDTIAFLSEMSHLRYTLRIKGFIPLIYFMIKMTNQLAKKLGYENNFNLSFMTHKELEQTIQAGKAVIPLSELKMRQGNNREYLVRVNDGRVEYYYGEEAGKLFAKLVPPVDLSVHSELSGVVAWSGNIQATTTVYNWGDDMDTAIESIKEHPILIAGQTRPAMMPLIRMAKGIVTDEGGVTSHAAIVARELGIPTIINTGMATKVFSTGDLVELNATEGVIRKVQS